MSLYRDPQSIHNPVRILWHHLPGVTLLGPSKYTQPILWHHILDILDAKIMGSLFYVVSLKQPNINVSGVTKLNYWCHKNGTREVHQYQNFFTRTHTKAFHQRSMFIWALSQEVFVSLNPPQKQMMGKKGRKTRRKTETTGQAYKWADVWREIQIFSTFQHRTTAKIFALFEIGASFYYKIWCPNKGPEVKIFGRPPTWQTGQRTFFFFPPFQQGKEKRALLHTSENGSQYS